MRRWSRSLLLSPVLLGALSSCGREVDLAHQHPSTPFLVGANNYYLVYKPRTMVDDVLESAAAIGLTTIRTWAFIDRGSLDGFTPNVDGPGHKDGVYFQYWDRARGTPTFNDGEDGLERLDYVVAKARQLKIRLILVLTGNWVAFGGIDQYVAWYGLDAHHRFFSDSRTRQAYKNWVTHLLNRVNTLTNERYADDPTILAWELANEPRCNNDGRFNDERGCDADTIVAWADEMSAHIKSNDTRHMVSVGDEGFLAGGDHWTHSAWQGVDHERLLSLKHVDLGTFHLFPQQWGKDVEWGVRWIHEHVEIARRLGKPTILEEYGWEVKRGAGSRTGLNPEEEETRNDAYRLWNQAALEAGASGTLVWMLSGRERDGRRYPDYDDLTIYHPTATTALITEVARAARDHSAPSAAHWTGRQ